MPTVTVQGVAYYYEFDGRGEPLVLVGGFGADHLFWEPLRPLLAPEFRVLTFDNPGTGRTRDGGGALTVEGMAEGVAALIGALGLERPHVAGHSMGGNIVLALAARHPERVGSAAILNAVPLWRPVARKAMGAIVHSYRQGVPLDLHLDYLLPWLCGSAFLDDAERVAGLRQALAANPHPPAPEGMERQCAAVTRFDGRPLLAGVRARALVVLSEEDILALPAECEDMGLRIPGARVARLPGGHSGPVEEPDALARAMRTFLKP